MFAIFFSNTHSNPKNITNTNEFRTLKHQISQRSIELESSCPIGPIDDYDTLTNMENLMNWQIDPNFKFMACFPEGIKINLAFTLLFYNIRQIRRHHLGLKYQDFMESLLSSRENLTIWERVNQDQA